MIFFSLFLIKMSQRRKNACMRTACWLVQTIHWVTSFPLSLCESSGERGELRSLQSQIIALLLLRDDPQTLTKWSQFDPPKCYLHSKEILAKFFQAEMEKANLLMSDQVKGLLVELKVNKLMIVTVTFAAKVLLYVT